MIIIRNFFLLILFLCCIFMVWMEILLRVNGNFYTYSEKAEGKYVSYYSARLSTSYHVYGPNQKANHQRKEFSYPFTANSLGLREKELQTHKADTTCRVLFLGDSFTEGVGAPVDSTFPAHFGNYLKTAYNIHAEIFNAGVSGSDPFYCYKLFADKLVSYHPDRVLLAVNSSDITDYIYRGGMERFQQDGTVHFRKGPWWEWLYRYSHFARWCIHSIFRFDETFTKPEDSVKTENEAREKIADCIMLLQQACEKNHCNFVVIIHPVPVEFRYGYSGKNDIRPLYAKLDSLGISSVSLYENMGNYLNEENILDYYWETDGHYNGKGYAVFAQAAAELVEEKIPGFLSTKCNEQQ